MKRLLFLTLAVVMVAALVLAGCAKEETPAPSPAPTPAPSPSPAPSPTPTPEPTPTPPAAAEPQAEYELKFTYLQPETATSKRGYYTYADTMERVSDGRIKVIHFPGQTLGKSSEHFDMVVSGLADMTCCVTDQNPGRFPLTDLITIPFVGFVSAEHATYVAWELIESFPQEFEAEYKGTKLLNITTCSPYIIGTSKPVRIMEDMKGLKLRTKSGPLSKAMEALGGTPVSMGIGDVYMSVERGILDGYLTDWNAIGGLKFFEVSNYFTEACYAISPQYTAMNLARFNSFPDELREKVMFVNGLWGSVMVAVGRFDENSYEFRKMVGAIPGKEIIILPANEVAKFRETTKEVASTYIAGVEAKGLPGQSAYNKMLELSEFHRARLGGG